MRKDIRKSFGASSGTAKGVRLTLTLTLLDGNCEPLAKHAIYLWHATRDGKYSTYGQGVEDEHYLRGVQETDACEEVYATDGYADSADNLAKSSLTSDMVFSDGTGRQVAEVSGTVDGGMTAKLSLAA